LRDWLAMDQTAIVSEYYNTTILVNVSQSVNGDCNSNS